MHIRQIHVADLLQLQQISKYTFVQTFAADNTADDMQQYLHSSFAQEKLLTELSTPNTAFYFAEIDAQVVGYLKLNWGKSTTALPDDNGLEIERIYVLQQYHGKKVGQALYNYAEQIATSKKWKYIWLGVWEQNTRAIQFYEKNGFVKFDTHLFVIGNDAQTDILMKKNI